MPISTKLFNDQAINRFNQLTADIQSTQSKVATGKNVVRASDDPIAAANIAFTKDQKVMLDRFDTNIDRARTRLNLAENMLSETMNVVTRIYELTIQARNDSLSAVDRQAIGIEVSELRDTLAGFANSRDSAGNYLFSGYKSNQQPFVETDAGTIEFHGDRGVHSVQISETLRANTGLDGADLFMRVDTDNGTQPLFDIVDKLASDLEGGVINEPSIAEMEKVVDHIAIQQTHVGSQLSKINRQENVIERRVLLMEENLSALEDADLARLVTDLQSQIVSRDAAQQAFVKIGQQSLFDYIR